MTTSLTTEEQVCNIALSYLGVDPIVDMDTDGTTRADLCALHFDNVRDFVLSEREWPFAVVQSIEDTPDGTPPTNPEWGQRHALPTNTLRVLTVHPPTDVASDFLTDTMPNAEQIPWVVEGDWILCNYDEISVRIIQRIASVTAWTDSFVQAMAARLAADMAIALTASSELHAQMYALYQAKLLDAGAIDGMQGRSQRIRSRFLLSRR